MEYGLVLAGGGVRGAYQIGVWKALKELKIKVSVVSGVSIGAVNGALFVQGSKTKAERLWNKIAIDDIISLPKEMENDENLFKVKNLMKIAKEIYSNNGLDMSPLENLLNEIVDEGKIRNSEIDFGIATFSLSEKIISPQTLQSLPVRHTKKPLPDTIQILSQRFLIFPAPVHDSDTKHRQNDDHTDTVYSAMC